MTIKSYMIKVYAMLIKGETRTIEEIPAEYVPYVVEYLEKENGLV